MLKSDYKHGDYVCNINTEEIGRVVRPTDVCDDDAWFVCWHCGCTSAATPEWMMRPATEKEILTAPKDIGHHRFDNFCPDYIEDCCKHCCGDKAAKHESI
jgi:hypothetical protein